MEQYSNIKLEVIDKGIVLLTVSKPKSLNALNTDLIDQLHRAMDQIMHNKEMKVLLITGEGKAFVAGADIEEMKDMDVEEARSFSQRGQDLFRKIETMQKPVIAAINGYALGGGCELAMCCDIRIAGDKAKFGQPEVGLGITPGFGGTLRLPRIVGMAKAKELIFTGDIIDANEALRLGLVNNVVPQDELLNIAKEVAVKIGNKSNMAVKYAKSAINRGYDVDMDIANEIERDVFALCFACNDQKEGMNAFIEKRNPNFK